MEHTAQDGHGLSRGHTVVRGHGGRVIPLQNAVGIGLTQGALRPMAFHILEVLQGGRGGGGKPQRHGHTQDQGNRFLQKLLQLSSLPNAFPSLVVGRWFQVQNAGEFSVNLVYRIYWGIARFPVNFSSPLFSKTARQTLPRRVCSIGSLSVTARIQDPASSFPIRQKGLQTAVKGRGMIQVEEMDQLMPYHVFHACYGRLHQLPGKGDPLVAGLAAPPTGGHGANLDLWDRNTQGLQTRMDLTT